MVGGHGPIFYPGLPPSGTGGFQKRDFDALRRYGCNFVFDKQTRSDQAGDDFVADGIAGKYGHVSRTDGADRHVFGDFNQLAVLADSASDAGMGRAVAVAAAMVWTHPGSVAVAIIPALISGKKIRTIVITGAALVIPLAVLAAGGMLMPFWKQALVFNQEVYAKFYPERRNNLTMSQQTWSDFWRNEAKLFTNLSWPVGVSQWLWHAGFWGLGIYAISKKNHRLVGIWLALFLTIHSREVKFFPGQMFNYALYPAVLTGTAALAIGRPVVKVALVIVIIASGVAAWPIFIQSAKPGYNYQVFWSDRVKLGKKVAKLTAKDETILAYYPVFDVFFFSRRLPADLFWYWHPWIAAGEGNSQDRQQTIERRIPAAIIPGQEKPSQAMVDNYEPVKDEPQIWIRK